MNPIWKLVYPTGADQSQHKDAWVGYHGEHSVIRPNPYEFNILHTGERGRQILQLLNGVSTPEGENYWAMCTVQFDMNSSGAAVGLVAEADPAPGLSSEALILSVSPNWWRVDPGVTLGPFYEGEMSGMPLAEGDLSSGDQHTITIKREEVLRFEVDGVGVWQHSLALSGNTRQFGFAVGNFGSPARLSVHSYRLYKAKQ